MPRSRLSKISRSRPTRSTGRKLRQPSLYSRTEEVREKRSHKGFLRGLVFLLALAGVVYLVFFSGVFAVQSIQYSSTKFVNREELAKAVKAGSLPLIDNNIITFGIFHFLGRVEKVTGVDDFSVRRLSQHSVLLEIVEKSPLLIWQTLDRKYLVDEDGIAWANYEDKYAGLPTLIDTKNLPVKLGDKIIPTGMTIFFKELEANFADTGFTATKFEIMDIVSDLKVTSSAGWYVYFDTSRTAKNELVSLKRVIAETKSNPTPLEYVDLRINNRIFYK